MHVRFRRFVFLVTPFLIIAMLGLPIRHARQGGSFALQPIKQRVSAAADARMHGTIKDGVTGQPLGGALISVIDTSLSARSGSDGSFSFADLTSGKHRLRIGLSGYEVKEIECDANDIMASGMELLLYPQASFTFSLEVAIEQKTFNSEADAIASAWDMIDKVNERFNRSGELKAKYNFQPARFSIFTDTADTNDGALFECTKKLHPNVDILIAVDGSAPRQGGYFAEPYFSILHCWPGHEDPRQDGPFSGFASDSIVHELGHARGAIDIYALEVDGGNNEAQPGTGYAFDGDSFMDYPYGASKWGDYATQIIDYQGGAPNLKDKYFLDNSRQNRLRVKVMDSTGMVLPGAAVSIYPVYTYSARVGAMPLVSGQADRYGLFEVGSGVVGFDVDREDNVSNAFIMVDYKGMRFSSWLSLIEINQAFWAGRQELYEKSVQAPSRVGDMTGPTIEIIEPKDHAIFDRRLIDVKCILVDDVGVDEEQIITELDGQGQNTETSFDGSNLLVTVSPHSKGNHVLTISAADYRGQVSKSQLDFDLVLRPGDVTGDASVDIFDLVAVSMAFNEISTSPVFDVFADTIQDGIIDIFDLIEVARCFGSRL